MRYLQVFLAIALGVPTLCLVAETKECDTTSAGDGGSNGVLELHTPDQLGAFEGCTTLNGHILIQSDYDGDFTLNGVTEVHGNISTVDDGAEGLGLFEMGDLEKIDNIHLLGQIGDVNLPKLSSLGDLELVQKSNIGKANLTSLSEADNLSVRGSWTSTDFSSLKTVTVECQFCGSQTCSIYGDSKTFPYITVDLPLLEKADKLEVAGTVESVSLPNLAVVGYIEPTGLYRNQGLRINIEEGYDKTLDFDAPNLRTLNGSLEVYGGVSSLSLPSLKNTTVGATLNTRGVGLDVYSTIETATNFYIWGVLRSIYLPNMVDLGSVALSYTPRIPCNDTLYRLWQTQDDNSSEWDDYNSCLDYDYPQDEGGTSQVSTTATATSTGTSGTSGGTASSSSSSDNTASASATQGTGGSSQGAEDTETDIPKSGALRSFSTSLMSRVLLMLTVISLSLR